MNTTVTICRQSVIKWDTLLSNQAEVLFKKNIAYCMYWLVIKIMCLSENWILIFSDGLSIIQAETRRESLSCWRLQWGLVLGERADAKTLDKNNKCIIEAEFSISHYNLKDFS